jgi:hypothetical protein
MNDSVVNRRLVLGAATAGLVGAASTAVVGAPPNRGGSIALPVNGITSAGTELFGVFAPTQFLVDSAGNLLVTGLMTLSTGQKKAVTQSVTMPVTAATSAACTILDLTLGPLHLDLLGLVVDLNQIHLVLTAVPGSGLLGDLLCAVANLLSGGLGALLGNIALLNQLAALLNQILGLFG